MTPPIVLVHGLWLTPRNWEHWKERFEERGHEVFTPAWPHMEVEAIGRDPPVLNGLGVPEVVDHYDRIIRSLGTPPVIMGHACERVISTGGVVADRGQDGVEVSLLAAALLTMSSMCWMAFRRGSDGSSRPSVARHGAPAAASLRTAATRLGA
jgi:hypothetical protein